MAVVPAESSQMTGNELRDPAPRGIAIVGMSGRFPRAADVDEFWRNLAAGVDAAREYTPEDRAVARLGPEVLRHPDYVGTGYYLDDVKLFDAEFFGFSPAEARITDPQHRIFMECVWEALESAGYVAKTGELRVGVYAGASLSHYLQFNLQPTLECTRRPTHYLKRLIGNDKDYLATHVSYKLNLRGPSISVQTACSTSLVALGLACQGLFDYQCDLALAGGVTVRTVTRDSLGYLYEEGNVLSPDGHCRPFDAEAAGTVFGSGAGVVVLKRLEEALEDRDDVLAVVREVVVNNDGSLKVGYTAPSLEGQAEVIALAQAMAEVHPETVTLLEAHGTGTPLGDPIEIAALTRAFRARTGKKGFCALGSVKSNVGHLESAAGAAGLIKTVQALRHRQIPPSLHFRSPNPEIDFDATPFFVNTELREWTTDGATPRRAGVSSFGMGGTNAHVIVEEAPPAPELPAGPARPLHLLTLSARDDRALSELAERYDGFLAAGPDAASVAFTSNTGRRHFDRRLAVIGDGAAELRERLGAFRRGEESAGVVVGSKGGEDGPSIAFLLPGEGAEHPGMGRELYRTQPTFRRALDRCAEILRPHLDRDLLEVLDPAGGDASPLHQAAFAQPALFAFEFALAELWRSWGIRPAALLGHGVGEYAAACLAGVFSLEEGLALVTGRARLVQSRPPEIPWISTLSGEEVAADAVGVDHRVEHAVRPVRFASGVEALRRLGCTAFLEVGPHPVLLGMARHLPPGESDAWLPTLHRGRPDWLTLLSTLGRLYVAGAPVDWEGFDRDYPRRRITQPTYPFQRRRHWLEEPERAPRAAGGHPLLGSRIRLAGSPERRFESRIDRGRPAFLDHHRIFGAVVLPASGYVEMALAAAAEVLDARRPVVAELALREALALPEEGEKVLQTVLEPGDGPAHRLRIYSLEEPGDGAEPRWTLHAEASVRAGDAGGEPAPVELDALRREVADEVAVDDFYRRCAERELRYGAALRTVRRLWRVPGRSLAELALDQAPGPEGDPYALHPALLDGCLQAAVTAFPDPGDRGTYLPVSIGELELHRPPPERLWCHARVPEPEPGASAPAGSAQAAVDVALFDGSGEPVASLRGLAVKRVSREAIARTDAGSPEEWLYEVVWRPQPGPATPAAGRPVVAGRRQPAGEARRTLAEPTRAAILAYPILEALVDHLAVVVRGLEAEPAATPAAPVEPAPVEPATVELATVEPTGEVAEASEGIEAVLAAFEEEDLDALLAEVGEMSESEVRSELLVRQVENDR